MAIDTTGACSRCGAQLIVIDGAVTYCDACASVMADGRNDAEKKKAPRAKKPR